MALVDEGGVRTVKVTPKSSHQGSSPLYLTVCHPWIPFLETVAVFLKSSLRPITIPSSEYSLLLTVERDHLVQAMESDQTRVENMKKLGLSCWIDLRQLEAKKVVMKSIHHQPPVRWLRVWP